MRYEDVSLMKREIFLNVSLYTVVQTPYRLVVHRLKKKNSSHLKVIGARKVT